LNNDILTHLDASTARPPGRLLLIGAAIRFESALREQGWDPACASDALELGITPGSCDVIVAENVLARDPWDRWALQKMHRALRVGGTLLIVEPNRTDLSTPGGVLYVLERGVREVLRRTRHALGRPVDLRPSLRGRKPSASTLAAMLEGLRFEQVESWFDRRGGWGRLLPKGLAPHVGACARTRPSIAGLRDAWPDSERHRHAYERAQARLLATCDRWTRAHERWTGAPPATFDATAYAGSTVLVLAPHPDDEVIGAGGAMIKLVRAGARVVCLQATDGSAGAALEGLSDRERREVRLREARSVAARLGLARLDLWSADNGDFRATDDLVDRMCQLLEEERPALVFLPFVTEAHPDHVTLAIILARGLARLARPLDALVLGYEVWSIVPATHVHDITGEMEDIESLLFLYDCAMRIDDFVHFCADRALYHGFRVRGVAAYLEAFHAVHARDFPELLRTVTPTDG
jgi:LmbE family N-acetylglucosaminyl deacetylase